MRWLKQDGPAIVEYDGVPKMAETMLAAGWIGYAGTLPLSRLAIVDGAVAELPAPEPSVKRYSKLRLYDAIGRERWTELLAQLTADQCLRLDLAQELATDDADFAAAVAAISAQYDDAAAVLAAAEL